MSRFEVVLLGFGVACALVALFGYTGWVRIEGTVTLGLYPLFSMTAVSGWLSGNAFVYRSYRQGRPARRLLPVWVVGPLPPLLLLRAMAPAEWQQGDRLVPLLQVAVFMVFFLVPWTLRFTAPPPPRLRIGKDGEDERGG